MKELSFEDFVASKVEMSTIVFAKYYVLSEEEVDNTLKVLVYSYNLFITVIPENKYVLVLNNQNWITSDLNELEHKLYEYGVNEFFVRPIEERLKENIEMFFLKKNTISRIWEIKKDELYGMELEATDEVNYLIKLDEELDIISVILTMPYSFLNDY